ncbi:hypothetical protein L208DRAFT_1228058, partial [Tricholoma matsutake]
LSQYEVSFHTLHNGTHCALSSSFACNACKIRYHHNYYTNNHLHLRYYYYSSTVPSNIQIEEHTFVDAKLCEFFMHLSLFAWVSAQNNANVFNHTLSDTSSGSTGDKIITSEQVSRAFVVNALLWESAENAAPLIVLDIGDNDERTKQAMELHNKRMIDEGQPHLMHACKVCSFRAIMMDGTSIGCPCCNVHNCTQPLLKHCTHFCAGHEYKKNECVVMDCGAPVQPGFWMCTNSSHRALEQYRNEKGKAFFQLKQRLQKSNTSCGSNSMGQLMEDDEDEIEQIPDTRKSDLGNQQPKACFGQWKTHNEQLVVACCGVIVARGMMFGAELISGVKDFLKSVYPHPEDLPDVVFFDNNCHLQSHLQAQGDNFF